MAREVGPGTLRRLAGDISVLIEQLDTIVGEATEALASLPTGSSPQRWCVRAFGSILHDFYTAVEDVFEAIVQDLNGSLPAGKGWHTRFLRSMAAEIPGVRPAVVSKESTKWLEDYLSFRHVFRNVYGHRLEWSRMGSLVKALPALYDGLRKELVQFTEYLTAMASHLEEPGNAPEE